MLIYQIVKHLEIYLIKDILHLGFPNGVSSKEPACQCRRDSGLIPGLGRSRGGGRGNPLQYSCLENPSWTEEPGGLQSIRFQRVGHNLVTEQQINVGTLGDLLVTGVIKPFLPHYYVLPPADCGLWSFPCKPNSIPPAHPSSREPAESSLQTTA